MTEPDGLAHYIRITDLLLGPGVKVALCGKKYVPTVVGAEVLERKICSECAELMGFLEAMNV